LLRLSGAWSGAEPMPAKRTQAQTTDTAWIASARPMVDEVLREYLWWVVDRFVTDLEVPIDDPAAMVEHHHQLFQKELPNLLGPRGRLLVARLGDAVAGVGALKPVDEAIAEIKRMYVRPQARGLGIGRAMLQRLVDDARDLGYRKARLETGVFMTEAQTMYRSFGFRDIPMFDNAETAMSDGLTPFVRFMELPL
jgi:GNAT superfamily N-acetyltransferase